MSPDELKSVVANGTWDSCKMHVLLELVRINQEIDKLEKKYDRLLFTVITGIVGIVIAVVAQIILKGLAK